MKVEKQKKQKTQKPAMGAHRFGPALPVVAVMLLMLGLFSMVSSPSASADSGCVSLADLPLEVRGQGAPGIVNVVWDASGSMLWTIFTDNDFYTIGGTEYAYVFPESEYYYTGSWGTPLPTNSRHHWQTQCSEYNRMYYDPDVDYQPWPRWTSLTLDPDYYRGPGGNASGSGWLEVGDHELDFGGVFHADINTPRQHPTKPHIYPTFDLNANFYNFEIDDSGPDIIKFETDQTDNGFSSSPGLGSWVQWPDAGYVNGGYHNIRLNRASTTAEWEINVTQAGEYEVMVSISGNSNRTQNAVYTVLDHNNNVLHTQTVSQYRASLQQFWVSLGAHHFQTKATIRLACGRENNNYLAVDAVKLVEPGTSGGIIFAHYFTQNDNGDVFLINLDGEITYFRADLGSDLKTVDRLIPMTSAQAAAAGIVTGRTWLEERQNFADWYQFYRRRYFTGIAAAGQFIDGWSNIFLSFHSFPESYGNHSNFTLPSKITVAALDMTIRDTAGNEDYYNEKDIALYALYTMIHPWGHTPMRDGLYQSGRFFEAGTGWSDLHGQSPYRKPIERSNTHLFPYFKSEFGGECQQAFAVLMTDGMWNGDLSNSQRSAIGNADGDNNTDFDGAPYGDSYSHTLADIAMYFYERDLKPEISGQAERSLANYVPTAEFEDPRATHQRQIVYGISFGIPGIYTDEQRRRFAESLRRYPPEAPTDSDWAGWPQPESGTNSTIDDLWHATINARGDFFSANNPQRLVEAMAKIKDDIEKRLGTASAVSTNTVQRQVGTLVYQAQFDSSRWSGDLLALPVDPDSGIIGNKVWSARDQLEQKDADDRVIFTFSGAGGIPFRYAGLSADQRSLLNADPATAAQIVDYLRGDDSLESKNGGPFRNRDGKLGDIVHSEPFYHKGVVYAGANDGMLHAFDAQTGRELFAFVPDRLMDRLAALASPTYSHQYYVDGVPYVRTIAGGKSILACGFGKGGKGLFGLDVTNAKTADEGSAGNMVLWEYPGGDDPDMGYTYPQPFIVYTRAAGWVVAAANGYDSPNGDAVLFILNPLTGGLIRKLSTESAGADGCNGLSVPAVVDVNMNGYVDYAYAGDLKGNLWKFDLTGENVGDWHVFFSDGATPRPMFTAQNAAGQPQPITSRPDVMLINSCDPYLRGYLVAFGTGKYLGEADLGDFTIQTFYGIYDWSPAYDYMGEDVTDKYLGTFMPDRTLSNASGLTLLEQTVESDSAAWRILSDNEIDYYTPQTDLGEHAGWFFDLSDAGERMVRTPQIRRNAVIFVTNTPIDDPCASGGSSILYQVDACGGGRTRLPQFDINGDKKFDAADLIEDLPPTGMKFPGIVYDPKAMEDTLLIATSEGEIEEVNIPPNPPGRSYWRWIE